jgi:hypothetical protein
MTFVSHERIRERHQCRAVRGLLLRILCNALVFDGLRHTSGTTRSSISHAERMHVNLAIVVQLVVTGSYCAVGISMLSVRSQW